MYSDQIGVWELAIPVENTCSVLLECGRRSVWMYPPWMVETSRCLSAKGTEPSLNSAFLLFCLWQSCSSPVSNVQSYWCHFRNTPSSWAGCKWTGKGLRVMGWLSWLSRSEVLQGLWFLWMALKEKDGRAVISEWSQRWSGAWQWAWPTYAEMWEGGLRTTEGLACLPRQCWSWVQDGLCCSSGGLREQQREFQTDP